ncbi:MAG TPA: fibronectin type III domain-containing protein [Thermoanaerobaculia bacterium]|nr:fibronectin type III domain-containing protein [Thermoanaerobaculia bacterium]
MKRALWLCILLPLLAMPAVAAPFGEAFPLTNTRYRSAVGEPRLVTNDRDFFLFWGAERKIRAARVDDGEARVSHVVLDTYEAFDVAWTGEQYVIVGTRTTYGQVNHPALVGRVLDAEAHPVGPEFSVVLPDADNPRIAAGAHSIAVVYTVRNKETRVVILSKNGRVESPSRVIAPYFATHAVTRRGDGFLAIVSTNEGIRAVALDRHGQTIADRTFAASPAYRYVAVASDGTSSLAMWCDNDEVVALPIDEQATFGAPLQLYGTPGSHTTPTVIWNGAGWTASYTQHYFSTFAQAVILQLDWRAQKILSREESAMGNVTPTVAALDGRALAAWRPSGQDRAPVVAALPLAASQPRPTPWAPTTQTLLASASSSNATLTVWSEPRDGGVSIHAGVRNLQGQWSEQQLGTLPYRIEDVLAASDGDGFAVAYSSSLIRLDGTGRVTAKVTLPLYPRVMAWNGTNYGLLDQDGLGVLVSPAGVMSAPVDLEMNFDAKVLASDGNGFFVAGDMDFCFFPACGPIPLHGIRLGPDLTRVDAEDYVLRERDGVTLIGVAWDGSRYFAIAHDYDSDSSFIAYMPPLAGMVIETKNIEPGIRPEAMTMLRDGTVAIAGRNGTSSRVAFMKVDGTMLQTSEIEGLATAPPRLEPLADGGVAFIASTMQNAAPHDGANRITTAIARSSGVLPPGSPHVRVRVQNGFIEVDWTAPSGTVNGYRLEYRIDDDEWVELEQWFAPGMQRKVIRKPSFGTQFGFRVRAFNDGGAGLYSATAFTKPSRRRAVR